MTMVVTVNGEPRDISAHTTVTSIVELLRATHGGRGVAVAVDGEVVPRTAWSTTELTEGAHVEVVAAVQGG